jgi:hypothetical protein
VNRPDWQHQQHDCAENLTFRARPKRGGGRP